MSRIVTVYSPELRSRPAVEMGYIRWHRMSAALASLGHTVDIASAELRRRVFRTIEPVAPNLRIVPISQVRWREYDAVKTHYHHGFQTLERYGGADHEFLIAHLGSVVGPADMEGIFFYGRRREELYRVQERIDRASRYVSLLSAPAECLWRSCFQTARKVLLVPGAASAEIPAPRRSPYPLDGRSPCVVAGSFFNRKRSSQPEAHRTVASKLNRLGALLDARGARLYVVGTGDQRSLNPRYVTYCGAVPYEDCWDYLHFAAVGIALTSGGHQHNNESTRIYYYLRAGLPVVSEAGFPNDNVVLESGVGHVVENGALDAMAERIVEAAHTSWDRERAIRYILDNHTWEKRAEIYDRILRGAPET
jgi:glycosyltransferase involved in cell wall biosynthesis